MPPGTAIVLFRFVVVVVILFVVRSLVRSFFTSETVPSRIRAAVFFLLKSTENTK